MTPASLCVASNRGEFPAIAGHCVGRLSEAIPQQARNEPEGAPATANGLLHLGSRSAVNQTVSRLAHRGEPLRAERGLCVAPTKSRCGTGVPSAWKTVQAIAAQRAVRLSPTAERRRQTGSV